MGGAYLPFKFGPPLPPGTRPVAALGYEVLVGSGLLAELAPLFRHVFADAQRTLLVIDDGLPKSTTEQAAAALESAGLEVSRIELHADEEHKSIEALGAVLAAAATARLERDEPIVALGGGIVGDVAGFAAATYRRGVPVVQLPTTLLSMVDSSVGGKTGVNIRVAGGLQKNMAGAFHQPALVVCDVATLRTLPDRELCSGMAECVKHGLIGSDFGDPTLLAYIEQNVEAILARREPTLTALVARNVAVKVNCVARDEQERRFGESPHGGRMALNCGHTVAHAIETLPEARAEGADEPGLTHGEAVAIGLVAESVCAEALGLAPAGSTIALRALLGRLGLPTRASGLPAPERILELMHDDKKVSRGKLRMALPAAENRARLVTGPKRDAVLKGIVAITA